MPIPMEYRLASQNFDRLLGELVEHSDLTTRNQAYTTLQAVLQCFRRRLCTADAITFAQILPAMLRALFVQDWDVNEPLSDTWNREVMTREVKLLRINHNFSSDGAIADVAAIVRRHVDPYDFARCMEKLPPQARDFWS